MESHKKLEAGGVEVIDNSPDYDVTHEKSMVVDDTTAFVKSLSRSLPKLRDRLQLETTILVLSGDHAAGWSPGVGTSR